jgi:carbamoyl-phosphate synthase small subunit
VRRREGVLVLSDGTSFEGELCGAGDGDTVASGEVVFNTVMSGYQEVLSDPSYAGQIITFTTSHLGNYGVNPTDDESQKPHCRGVVLRELSRMHSNWRATEGLDEYLRRNGVAGISGVDTRALTRHLREHGALPGAFGANESAVRTAAAAATPTDGIDLVRTVTATTTTAHNADSAAAALKIVALDCGIKTTITRHLTGLGSVQVVPATTSAADILALDPDGVFLSNGPGDPAAAGYVLETVTGLLGRRPIFGICMGHQMLAAALGARIFKLPFGHHGGNHPVQDLRTGTIEITSQNHNYCVDPEGTAGLEVTHVNLNDDTLEGIRATSVPAFGIQYHPEAGPGPHDSSYLFAEFAALIREHSAAEATR